MIDNNIQLTIFGAITILVIGVMGYLLIKDLFGKEENGKNNTNSNQSN